MSAFTYSHTGCSCTTNWCFHTVVSDTMAYIEGSITRAVSARILDILLPPKNWRWFRQIEARRPALACERAATIQARLPRLLRGFSALQAYRRKRRAWLCKLASAR